MDRLKIFAVLLIALPFAVGLGIPCRASDEGSAVLNWERGTLEIVAAVEITPQESGNIIRWQYDANLSAAKRIEEGFIRAMAAVRVGAYDTAHAVLLKEPERNEKIYRYIADFKEQQVSYTDRLVTVKSVLPLFGRGGFAHLLVSAGLDPGSFPAYSDFVYSVPFTGLVVDARGLGRVPAIAPRILDEEHRVVYSIDCVNPKSFTDRGAVQYSADPYYRGFQDRVGKNPLRVVALANDKLIETDIAISNTDAMTLLQNGNTRKSLEEGRVIIIIDEGVILQRRDYRF